MKKKIDQYLIHFQREISLLTEAAANVVAGGSLVLELHGLKLGWEPLDLDIIIFSPTASQLVYVCDSKLFEKCLDYGDEKSVRSWKRESGSITLNIIFAHKEEVPSGLMYYHKEGLNKILCNSIENIIKAKVSYAEGTNKDYIRAKDMKHLSSLKNNNFNI